MKYPAILKNTIGGQTVLAVSGKLFIHMSGEFEVGDSESYSFDSHYKNITAEYLANTYGEVKSKGHAEFIAKLAEVNGIDFDGKVDINSNYFCFLPSNSKQLIFWRKENDASKHGSRKQITIPLPPECESVDEWPKVNDTVSLRYRFDSKQVMYTGELLYLSSNHIIINTENGNDCHCIRSEWDIEKPKTPEQELRDVILDCDNFAITENKAMQLAEWLSSEGYRKKPQ